MGFYTYTLTSGKLKLELLWTLIENKFCFSSSFISEFVLIDQQSKNTFFESEFCKGLLLESIKKLMIFVFYTFYFGLTWFPSHPILL